MFVYVREATEADSLPHRLPCWPVREETKARTGSTRGRKPCRGQPPHRPEEGYFSAAEAAFFCAAQRRLTASTIRFRPSAEMFLFFFFAGFAATGAMAAATFLGLPGFFFGAGAWTPASTARACCNWAIS